MSSAILHDCLHRFTCQRSDDPVKTDLELTCTECGEVVCDVEDGDALLTLAHMAVDHLCEPDLTSTDDTRET